MRLPRGPRSRSPTLTSTGALRSCRESRRDRNAHSAWQECDLHRHVAERLPVEVDAGRAIALDAKAAGMHDFDQRVAKMLRLVDPRQLAQGGEPREVAD